MERVTSRIKVSFSFSCYVFCTAGSIYVLCNDATIVSAVISATIAIAIVQIFAWSILFIAYYIKNITNPYEHPRWVVWVAGIANLSYEIFTGTKIKM